MLVANSGVSQAWPPMTLTELAKDLKREARKEGSCSEPMQLSSEPMHLGWKGFVDLAALPHKKSIGMSLREITLALMTRYIVLRLTQHAAQASRTPL